MNFNARLSLSAALFVVACSPPPTPKEVAAKTGAQASALVQEAMTAAQVANDLKAVDALIQSYNTGARGSVARPTVPASNSADEGMKKAQKFIEDRVFTEKNVESSGGGSVTFLLEGDDICTDGTTVAAPSCIEQVNKVQVRLRATPQPGDGMDLTLIIGASKFEPLTLQVRPDSLALQVDLAASKSAYEAVQTALSQPLTTSLTRLAGLVEMKLARNGKQDFTLSYSALKDIEVGFVSDGITRSYRTAAKSPMYSFRAERLAQRLTIDYDVGLTEYNGVYRDIAPTAPVTNPPTPVKIASTTPMKLVVGGLSFGIVLADGQKDLAVGHIGLGDAQSSVFHDGKAIFTADLNAMSGRRFDLRLTKDPNGGTPLIHVSPQFNLALMFFFDRLRALEGATVDAWLLDESYVASLTGATPTLQAITKTSTFEGGMKVVSGELKLSSNKSTVGPIVVTAGQCVTNEPKPAAGAHGFLGKFKVTACP